MVTDCGIQTQSFKYNRIQNLKLIKPFVKFLSI